MHVLSHDPVAHALTGGNGRANFDAGAGRRGFSSQLQSVVALHGTGSTHSSAHAPASHRQNPPCFRIGGEASVPGRHTPSPAMTTQSASTLHAPVFGAGALRRSVHRDSMHVHVPGGARLLSQPTSFGGGVTHFFAKHSSSQPQSLSVVQ
jgi:hypothetical protein